MRALATVAGNHTAATDYARLRDRIEAVSAITHAFQASAEILDDESCDGIPVSSKADVADRIWSALISEISRLDV